MSWLFAAIYDRFMRKTEDACLRAWREELVRPLEGRVLEIGAGTGANLPFYSPRVELVLTEPDPHMRARLHETVRRVATPRPSRWDVVAATADSLPFRARSFDAVVSTLVLCSVADLRRSLDEIRRVLRPGGSLVFIEHVAADGNPSRLAWQKRLEPFWKRLAGNCHLTHRTAEAIEAAGFSVVALQRESLRKALPWVRPSVRGRAIVR